MLKEKVTISFNKWFKDLELYSGFPARGTIGGALVVLERLETEFSLDIDAHTAKGGSQVRGASGEAVKRILKKFGETRRFVSQGGRTNRGLRGDIRSMLAALADAGLGQVPPQERQQILEALQRSLVSAVGDFHKKQRIKFVYDLRRTTRNCVKEILTMARKTGKEGPVAQYLVGAKLKLRFPGKEIENASFSTADAQLSRPGDFFLGTTAFHVTVAPMPAVFDRCQQNLDNGLRPFLLVPERLLQGTRQNAELNTSLQVEVESIESFIAQNIFELSEFSSELLPGQFRLLLDVYNERVNAVEVDKSMLIEVPPNLTRTVAR
jgi:hypothetical protein